MLEDNNNSKKPSIQLGRDKISTKLFLLVQLLSSFVFTFLIPFIQQKSLSTF